jgi:hypothetical protein
VKDWIIPDRWEIGSEFRCSAVLDTYSIPCKYLGSIETFTRHMLAMRNEIWKMIYGKWFS